jgi:eukaryotic-like serine/threonine-protein kinase
MRCPLCDAENDEGAATCFTCGRAFDALTQGSVLSGRYEVRRVVGSGGMGRVYEAFDRVLEEPVAIKVLRAELTGDPEVARRFLYEIKLARRISHSRVCRIHEYGEADGIAFISMEYISGLSLKMHLAAGTPSLSHKFDLALQIAEGLAAIHQHGIVHRDLKSANIMVDQRGAVKILDFGIAKQTDGGTAGLTAGDRIFGTPEYMSPEQVEGGAADARSDIYALGCVIFEIFTGRPPFQAETPYATLLKHLKEPPPLDAATPGLPAVLLPVLSRSLAKERNARFRSVTDLMTALRAARESASEGPAVLEAPGAGTARARPTGHGDTVTIFREKPLGGRKPWLWAAAAVAIAVAVILVRESGPAPSAPGRIPSASLPVSLAPATPPPPTTLPPAPPTTEAPSRSGPDSPTLRPTPRASMAPSTLPAPVVPSDQPPSTASRQQTQASPGPRQAVGAGVAPPSTVAAAPAQGTLALMIVPEAEVLLDGRSIGVVGQRDIPLAPGQHRVEVFHPDYQPLPRLVTIRSAEATTLLLDLHEKGIRKLIDKKK